MNLMLDPIGINGHSNLPPWRKTSTRMFRPDDNAKILEAVRLQLYRLYLPRKFPTVFILPWYPLPFPLVEI